MTLATRAELITEVQSWLFGRDDIAAKVPTFIRMFEAKANRILRCRQMEERAYATADILTGAPEFISLPDNFQTMRRVRMPEEALTRTLKFAVPSQLDALREQNNAAGTPEFFTVFGTQLELYPTPNAATVLEMIYRRTLPPLVEATDTNWLLDSAPDLYLYGTLMEAAPYLHEDERIPTWASGVQGGFADLNKLSDDATYNAGPLIIRRRRGGYS